MYVNVETGSELTKGATICDVFDRLKKKKNATVTLKMDVPGFWDIMLDCMEKANKVSILN